MYNSPQTGEEYGEQATKKAACPNEFISGIYTEDAGMGRMEAVARCFHAEQQKHRFHICTNPRRGQKRCWWYNIP